MEGGRYWPIFNEYDKEKNIGVMIFNDIIREIPGIIYHPFLDVQTNLLTLQLPNTITKIGRGPFYGCINLNYINFIDLVNLEAFERELSGKTNLTKIDLRNTKLTKIVDLAFSSNDDTARYDYEYILLPSTVTEVEQEAFKYRPHNIQNTIKTLMIPTLSPAGSWNIEDQITENLIINKFDGLGDLHYFNTDCIIWVPDEFYDGYVEKYTDNNDVENWQDIVSRLRRYSEGVPEFPME